MRGAFKLLYDDPESPREGPCIRYTMVPNRFIGQGVFKLYDSMMDRYGPTNVGIANSGSVLKRYDEADRQIRERV